jgi:SSS family solute:Na+ symporter
VAFGGLKLADADWLRASWSVYLLVPAFGLVAGSAVLIVVCGLTREQPESAEAGNLVWGNPLAAVRGESWRGLGNYRVVAALLAAVMVALYWVFR